MTAAAQARTVADLRATGHVRIVNSVADFDAFEPGEVLVARATAPAWTPLFERAAAVITDAGTLAAHASLDGFQFRELRSHLGVRWRTGGRLECSGDGMGWWCRALFDRCALRGSASRFSSLRCAVYRLRIS